jgi:hypothetical protein
MPSNYITTTSWHLFFLHVFKFPLQPGQLLFQLQYHGEQYGLEGPGPGGVAAGLDVEPGPVEKPIQDLLVLPAQGPAELLPVLILPLQHLAEGQYRPSHKLSLQFTAETQGPQRKTFMENREMPIFHNLSGLRPVRA